MKLKLVIALSAATLFLSIAGTYAVTVPGSDKITSVRSEAVKAGCVGGRRCRGYYTNGHGVRVCRGWVACH